MGIVEWREASSLRNNEDDDDDHGLQRDLNSENGKMQCQHQVAAWWHGMAWLQFVVEDSSTWIKILCHVNVRIPLPCFIDGSRQNLEWVWACLTVAGNIFKISNNNYPIMNNKFVKLEYSWNSKLKYESHRNMCVYVKFINIKIDPD